jgi:succinyl-CoA synthetase alpha subunit
MKSAKAAAADQKRGFHTYRQRPTVTNSKVTPQKPENPHQRGLHLRVDQSTALLKDYGIEVLAEPPQDTAESRSLVITVDRTARSPCIIVSPTTKEDQIHHRSLHIPFDFKTGPSTADIDRALEGLQLDASPPAARAATAKLITELSELYHAKEAISLEVRLHITSSSDKLQVYAPNFTFDDAAYRSTKRHTELHQQRDLSLEDPVEVSAEADGIVYIKLDAPTPNNEPRSIGTLVNGAGLAMNTVDALATHGGYSANFLDTGGKATSETVKRSFELILQDPRVKVSDVDRLIDLETLLIILGCFCQHLRWSNTRRHDCPRRNFSVQRIGNDGTCCGQDSRYE